jgi:hypothetical protein
MAKGNRGRKDASIQKETDRISDAGVNLARLDPLSCHRFCKSFTDGSTKLFQHPI